MEATTTTAVAASRSSCVLARFATARPLTPPHTRRRRTTTTKLSCLVSPSFFFSRPPVLCLRVSSSSRKSWNAGSSGDCGRSNNILPRVRSSPGVGGGGGGGGSRSSDDGDIEEWNDGGEQSRRRIGKDAAAAAAAAARVGMLVAALISLPGVVSLPPLAIGVEEEDSFSHVLQQEEDVVVFRGGLGMPSLQAPSLAGNKEASSRSCPSATGFSTIPSRPVRAKECLNEAMAVAAIHEGGVGGLPPECTEEAALNVIAKEAPVEEEAVTNESVVEEAWQVVHENFLDARHHSWSADAWLEKKEEALKRPIRSRMAAYGAIRSMLSSLNDPYTRFLLPDQFSQLAKYDVTGIGLNIGEVANGQGGTTLKVLGLVLGSPAQSAGVRQGDELLSVDGSSVTGKTAFEAASLIQGPKGTPVSIEIRHGMCGEARSLSVERQQDVRSPVYYRLEHSQDSGQLMGYIHLREFNALAKRDLVTAMKRLQDAGATSYLLDLQDNPGGLVQAGIEIARLFLDEGETVIETVGRDPDSFRSITASGPPLTKAPLMVLVNDHTASASEIVAAALHDNCRALLVGRRTFGKGLIQSVYELSDGSGIILTVGKYVTPGHHDIDGNGIEPDFKRPPGLQEAKQKLGRCHLVKEASNTTQPLELLL